MWPLLQVGLFKLSSGPCFAALRFLPLFASFLAVKFSPAVFSRSGCPLLFPYSVVFVSLGFSLPLSLSLFSCCPPLLCLFSHFNFLFSSVLLISVWSLRASCAFLVLFTFSNSISTAVLMSSLTSLPFSSFSCFTCFIVCLFLSSSLDYLPFHVLFCSWVVLLLKVLVLCNCVFLRILSVLYASPFSFLPVSPVLSRLVSGTRPSLNVHALISLWCLLFLEGLLVPRLFLLRFALLLVLLVLVLFIILVLLLVVVIAGVFNPLYFPSRGWWSSVYLMIKRAVCRIPRFAAGPSGCEPISTIWTVPKIVAKPQRVALGAGPSDAGLRMEPDGRSDAGL